MRTMIPNDVKEQLQQLIQQEANPIVRNLGQDFYDTLIAYEQRKDALFERDEFGNLPAITQQDRNFLIEHYDNLYTIMNTFLEDHEHHPISELLYDEVWSTLEGDDDDSITALKDYFNDVGVRTVATLGGLFFDDIGDHAKTFTEDEFDAILQFQIAHPDGVDPHEDDEQSENDQNDGSSADNKTDENNENEQQSEGSQSDDNEIALLGKKLQKSPAGSNANSDDEGNIKKKKLDVNQILPGQGNAPQSKPEDKKDSAQNQKGGFQKGPSNK